MALKFLIKIALLFAIVGSMSPAIASPTRDSPDREPEWREHKFELKLLTSLGGPLGLIGNAPFDESTPKFTLFTGVRAGMLRWSFLQLELNMVVPHGFGANLIWNVVHTRRFRLHLMDPGLFANIFSPVSAQNFERKYDLTLGAGFDLQLWNQVSLTGIWRVFLPSPFKYVPSHGHFMLPVYREAYQGGQIWLGATWRFWSW